MRDSSPDFVVEAFKHWLSEYIFNGAEFTDGQTIQYGYTLLKCRVQSRVLRLLLAHQPYGKEGVLFGEIHTEKATELLAKRFKPESD